MFLAIEEQTRAVCADWNHKRFRDGLVLPRPLLDAIRVPLDERRFHGHRAAAFRAIRTTFKFSQNRKPPEKVAQWQTGSILHLIQYQRKSVLSFSLPVRLYQNP